MLNVFARALIGIVAIPATVVMAGTMATKALTDRGTVLPKPVVDARLAAKSGEEVAVFAGGCFWGVEAVFEHMKGVRSVVSGYAGGTAPSPSYDEVSTGNTGHAESVRVVYDPSKVTYGQLLRVFFSIAHDPTQLNRQGPDVGPHYRSAVFYRSPEQQRIVNAYVAQLTAGKLFPRPIVTEISALRKFYEAEEYHQDYAELHPNQPYIRIHDAPKVANMKKLFPEMYRERDPVKGSRASR